jgi:hypothetical protein
VKLAIMDMALSSNGKQPPREHSCLTATVALADAQCRADTVTRAEEHAGTDPAERRPGGRQPATAAQRFAISPDTTDGPVQRTRPGREDCRYLPVRFGLDVRSWIGETAVKTWGIRLRAG